jgi:lipoxygenase
VTEAVIICTNRNLSKMHPIMQLMAPHFRSTLEINRTARATLIAAGGSIETHFTPKKYSLEMAAANYRDTWTFESQGLPNDLVARGMAVRDESAPHGVKLVVEDYPYAADGLELWSTIKGFNREYVDVYDKKDAPGWPELTSKESLVEVLTTIQWIPSCQHAAVNFGQYDYAGWMPHHPTMTRRLIPEEGTADWDTMVKNPEKYYLLTISNIDSTTAAMSVYEVLSAHSPNEEYIGQRQKNWTADEQVCILQAISNRFSSLSLM